MKNDFFMTAEILSGKEFSELDKKEYFVNREFSWLEFNRRVLGEARDREVPLFERLKFLGITASNIDEFFMVRVASLKDMVHAEYRKKDIAGLTPKKQLELISDLTHQFVSTQYSTLNRSLIPSLKKAGLSWVLRHEDLTKEEGEYLDRYFRENVYPVLTPMAVDASRPFPLIRNKSLHLAALLRRKDGGEKKTQMEKSYKSYLDDALDFALVQVPGVLNRIIELPGEAFENTDEAGRKAAPSKGKRILLLEELIERNLKTLFPSYDIVASHPFRIMRNAEFELDEEDAADLLAEIQKQLKKRQWGEVIRLEIEENANARLLRILQEELEVARDDIFSINGPLDLTVLMKMYGLEGFDAYRMKKHVPAVHPRFLQPASVFDTIREGDVLLSHPYESFDPVIDFIREAASDEQVLAIKQTLYRVSGNSPIIAALAKAAENGKQVSVLVELKARFDEENNINWAIKLEKAGCHVIYGLLGLKTHSKITLVVRREEDGIRRYVHLGTGNYNDSTAKLYTDLGMFTCRRDYGEDASAVFNMLSGYAIPLSWKKLVVAPRGMKERFMQFIFAAARAVSVGKPARIIAKMNSLSDKDIIKALYFAGKRGVEIDLIVRGICCLKTGIPGISESIRVRSIVGNFLEHSRIFYFEIDGSRYYYLGSADWMPRNLEKRVEVVFPVDDPILQEELDHHLDILLSDTLKAYLYKPDGSYERPSLRGKEKISAQEYFVREAQSRMKKAEVEHGKKQPVFE